MNRIKYLKCSMVFAVVMLITSCSYTKLNASWFDIDAAPRHYKKIAVVVLAPDKANRGRMENSLVRELKDRNVNAVNTLGVFPRAGILGEIEMDEEEMRTVLQEKVSDRRIDALLMVTLLDIKEEQHLMQGDADTYATPYYGGYGRTYAYPVSRSPVYGSNLYNYYYEYSTTVYDPDYYINTTSYFLETNLFDVATEKLIWSAQTTTTNPTSIEKEIKNYAGLIADQLMHDRVLK